MCDFYDSIELPHDCETGEEIPFCDKHQCAFELLPADTPGQDHYDCPECRREEVYEATKCTCPCIDCLEGNHCGGEYWWPPEPIENEDGTITEPELIGICEHIVLDDLFDDRDADYDDCGDFEWEEDGFAE